MLSEHEFRPEIGFANNNVWLYRLVQAVRNLYNNNRAARPSTMQTAYSAFCAGTASAGLKEEFSCKIATRVISVTTANWVATLSRGGRATCGRQLVLDIQRERAICGIHPRPFSLGLRFSDVYLVCVDPRCKSATGGIFGNTLNS